MSKPLDNADQLHNNIKQSKEILRWDSRLPIAACTLERWPCEPSSRDSQSIFRRVQRATHPSHPWHLLGKTAAQTARLTAENHAAIRYKASFCKLCSWDERGRLPSKTGGSLYSTLRRLLAPRPQMHEAAAPGPQLSARSRCCWSSSTYRDGSHPSG